MPLETYTPVMLEADARGSERNIFQKETRRDVVAVRVPSQRERAIVAKWICTGWWQWDMGTTEGSKFEGRLGRLRDAGVDQSVPRGDFDFASVRRALTLTANASKSRQLGGGTEGGGIEGGIDNLMVQLEVILPGMWLEFVVRKWENLEIMVEQKREEWENRVSHFALKPCVGRVWCRRSDGGHVLAFKAVLRRLFPDLNKLNDGSVR
ncbi:hypothetical protein C8R44DRAFT_724869 [Mycena epipterygia]|nr:hypothetical protein C8R44DRAFT_724869 [Mycena epipterygia]